MSLGDWITSRKENRSIGWRPRRQVLQSAGPGDNGRSVDRLDPEVFGPLYMRSKAEMIATNNAAEIVSKEYVDSYDLGLGRLNQSMRQPYRTGVWYSTSHGWDRASHPWVDGDCRVSAMYTSFDITIDALRIEVGFAAVGATARLGLYGLSHNDLLPQDLIVDGGTVAMDAVAIVGVTLPAPITIEGPRWVGLAVSVAGGAPSLWCDRGNQNGAIVQPQPYGHSAIPFSTIANSKYALLIQGLAGELPPAGDFTAASTSPFGSGLWIRRSA